ncbi:MAG: MFS family permease [Gammaproteobacteria bacterium]|jgi:MFS family permease
MIKLLRNEWQLLLFGFLMTFWSSPGQTFLISLFSGEIRADLNLSDGQFATVYSLATLASGIVVFWSGSLIDRLDLRKFSLCIVCLLAIGGGMISLSQGIIGLFFSLFMLRQFGQGLMTLTSSIAVVRYLDKDKGKASAIAGMGYAVAEAIMPPVLVLLLVWFGWRQSWQVMVLVMLALMIPAILLLLRKHADRHQNYTRQLASDSGNVDGNSRRQWTRAEVIRDKWFYLFMPGLMAQPLMFTGFIFHQVHLVESKGWSLLGWAALFSLYAIVSVVTKLLIGGVIDRFGAIRMTPLVALPMALGLLILANSTSLTGAATFLVLTGITVGFYSTVVGPFWSDMYGNRHLGAIKSMGSAVMVFCTAISPIVIGWQIDLGTSMDKLALIAAVLMLLSSLLAYYAYRKRPYNGPHSG